MKLNTHGLSLELQARQTANGEDWVTVHTVVMVPGFKGDFEADLQLDDLLRFNTQLQSLYEKAGLPGTAILSSADPGVRVELNMQALGMIRGKYEFESTVVDEPTVLSGGFSLDQSYLPALMESIEALVSQLRPGSAT